MIELALRLSLLCCLHVRSTSSERCVGIPAGFRFRVAVLESLYFVGAASAGRVVATVGACEISRFYAFLSVRLANFESIVKGKMLMIAGALMQENM